MDARLLTNDRNPRTYRIYAIVAVASVPAELHDAADRHRGEALSVLDNVVATFGANGGDGVSGLVGRNIVRRAGAA